MSFSCQFCDTRRMETGPRRLLPASTQTAAKLSEANQPLINNKLTASLRNHQSPDAIQVAQRFRLGCHWRRHLPPPNSIQSQSQSKCKFQRDSTRCWRISVGSTVWEQSVTPSGSYFFRAPEQNAGTPEAGSRKWRKRWKNTAGSDSLTLCCSIFTFSFSRPFSSTEFPHT